MHVILVSRYSDPSNHGLTISCAKYKIISINGAKSAFQVMRPFNFSPWENDKCTKKTILAITTLPRYCRQSRPRFRQASRLKRVKGKNQTKIKVIRKSSSKSTTWFPHPIHRTFSLVSTRYFFIFYIFFIHYSY